jgi:hypothetical protein
MQPKTVQGFDHGTSVGAILRVTLQKNQPEKCDFNQFKGFFMEKMVQIRQI